MAKRTGAKIKIGLFKDMPVNILMAPVLLIFIMQAALVMMYNNNILMFSNVDAYHSINRAAAAVDSKFKDSGGSIPSEKEVNGPLYPLLLMPIYAAAGASNLVPVLYILQFLMLFLLGLIFYRISYALSGRETAIAGSVLFIFSAPIVLSVFSGADTTLLVMLAALNAYFCFFHLPLKKYAGYVITAVLMFFMNYTGMILGAAALIYLILRINERKAGRNFALFTAVAFAVFASAAVYLLSAVFIKDFSMESLQSTGLLDTKTFMVDTFFKDGFLWSKILPPFMGMFFFLYYVVMLLDELKAKKAGFFTYAGFVVLGGFLTEFFAVLDKNSDTMLFIPPFLFLVILMAAAGAGAFASFIASKKGDIFTKNNMLYGIMIFMIVYSLIFTYNKTIERNNNIKYITGNSYVNKFF